MTLRAAFEDDVITRSRADVPLGAYAGETDVHYCFLAATGPLALACAIEPERPFHAFAPRFPVFAWDEREMSDERGVGFEHAADPRPFREHDGAMPAAIVAQGAGVMQIVVGPVHAGIIEPGRFTFSSGGETVVALDAQLGYAFRGVERALEGRDAVAAAPAVARICGSCSAARSHAYALALEAAAGTVVHRDVQLARLAICELERVYNHLGDLANGASGAGWMPGFARGMALKERAMRVNATACGHRLLFDAIVPGGVGAGVLRDVAAVRSELGSLTADVENYARLLFSNGSVVSRWRGTGTLPHATARAFGAVGPAWRASGGDTDVRVFAPYGAYRDVAVTPGGESGGDVLARSRVKRFELRESLRVLDVALARLEHAELAPARALEPCAGRTLATVEGPRGAETVAVHVDDRGRIERFHAMSASYRTWPLVALAMDGNIVPDFPLVNKSFNLCYACVDR